MRETHTMVVEAREVFSHWERRSLGDDWPIVKRIGQERMTKLVQSKIAREGGHLSEIQYAERDIEYPPSPVLINSPNTTELRVFGLWEKSR